MSASPGFSVGRMLAMARKEAIQLRRDPRSMVMAFLVPLALLLFFGYAITWDLKDLKLALRDEDGTRASRELVDAIEGSGYFRVVERLASRTEIDAQLQHARVTGVLLIPRGFSRDLAAGRPAPVQLLLDGADANTAIIAQNYVDAIAARWSAQVLVSSSARLGTAYAEPRVWYNPTLASRNMIVPGLIAVIMSIIAALLTALTVAREWERGTMEQLAATPVHRFEVVFGKLLPYLVIGLVDVATTTLLGVTLFGVPLHGSVLLLGGMTLLFLIGALGLGMFISAALPSQVLATQVAMVATYLPALLLSGFLYDVNAMPAILRWISHIVPARYYIAVTRGVFLKGIGVHELWIQGFSMILFATLGLTAATLMFRKRISA